MSLSDAIHDSRSHPVSRNGRPGLYRLSLILLRIFLPVCDLKFLNASGSSNEQYNLKLKGFSRPQMQ